MKRIINVFSTIFLILLIALVVLMFIMRLSGNSPSVFGYHVYRVSSDSMEPTLMVGDVILVGPISADKIHKSDIITYKAEKGEMEGQEITHRVVSEPIIENGKYRYQTQGDADGAPLDPTITDNQIVGRFITKLSVIEKLYSFFFTPYGLIAFIVLIFVLFGYELISLLVSYRKIDEADIEASVEKKTAKDKNKKE